MIRCFESKSLCSVLSQVISVIFHNNHLLSAFYVYFQPKSSSMVNNVLLHVASISVCLKIGYPIPSTGKHIIHIIFRIISWPCIGWNDLIVKKSHSSPIFPYFLGIPPFPIFLIQINLDKMPGFTNEIHQIHHFAPINPNFCVFFSG